MFFIATATLAAFVHLYIFYLESIAWSQRKTQKLFGVPKDKQDCQQLKLFAFNQGFYNLFLALAVIMGLYFKADLLALYALTSMLLAATVLILAAPKLKAAAFKQGLFPLIALLIYFLCKSR